MIFIILILGLGLRLVSINQSLWIDEATSASTIHMSLSQFFGKFMPGDFHPLLYYLMLRVWGGIFGTNEVALRSLSVLFGILTVYIVYLIGKELVSKETGIIASVLLATSGLHIYYSQETRMYAMSAFLVTFLIFSFVKILQKERVGRWVFLSILLGLIGLTDYLPLLIIPVFWIYGVLSKKDFKWFGKLFTSHIILGVGGLFWLPVFIKQLQSGINVVNGSPAWTAILGTFSLKDILLIPVKFMIGRVSFDNKLIYAGIVGFILILYIYIFYKARKYFGKLKLIWLWLFIPLGLSLVISIKIPVLNYFRFLFVLPAFYLIVASGVNVLNRKVKFIFLAVIITVNLITSFMYLTNIKFQREDWRGFVKFIGQAAVVFPADSQKEAFLYYNQNANIVNLNNLKNYKEIFLMRYAQPISDPQDSTRAKIENMGYGKVDEFDFNGVGVWKYKRL